MRKINETHSTEVKDTILDDGTTQNAQDDCLQESLNATRSHRMHQNIFRICDIDEGSLMGWAALKGFIFVVLLVERL